MNPTADTLWKHSSIHRGRFDLSICTRAFFREQHALDLRTDYAAEVRCDDDAIIFINFDSQARVVDFVRRMCPITVEITSAVGESVTELADQLQTVIDAERERGSAEAKSAIERAAKPMPE